MWPLLVLLSSTPLRLYGWKSRPRRDPNPLTSPVPWGTWLLHFPMNLTTMEFFTFFAVRLSTELDGIEWLLSLFLHCVHALSNAAVIKSQRIFPRIIPIKTLAENRTRASWVRSVNSTSVLCRPLKAWPSLLISLCSLLQYAKMTPLVHNLVFSEDKNSILASRFFLQVWIFHWARTIKWWV